MNDLPKELDGPSTLFSDDVSLVIPCKNDFSFKKQTDLLLTDITTWLSDHNLQINFSKTKLINFRPHQRQPINSMSIHGVFVLGQLTGVCG